MYQVRTSPRTELLRTTPDTSVGAQPLSTRTSEMHKHTAAREDMPISTMRCGLAARASSVRRSFPR